MENKRRILIAVLLLISIVNYSRIIGNENIRLIQFISIFVIGALSSLLIREIALLLRSKKEE
jgi:hypothetical protein